ncbi:hypothetical protein N5923_09945 [Erwiniaceae bacterium BAC15a-03b]|uniref:Uncharacterized protein n=1 Tax=Winslowiella arboricola TaxID=2978220 RepID=A0A9J6PM06_9GAMM|nr:hypothetical protein [Winslowiella arboricola]MCU5773091.1 hypothetical protein [Winslowiella arboricola]MCU5777814.1 hypothetical protein [Winslowiella arboricola]
MPLEDLSPIHKRLACVQFIAEVSLVANCKPSDLKLALTLIADLANSEPLSSCADEGIFYAVE